MNTPDMKRYESSEWNFAVDIPKHWNSFPPVSANSPYEVIRFASHEDGRHLLIIFRSPHDPRQSLREVSDQTQKVLAGKGFGNFVPGETTIRSRVALTLDFDKPQVDANSALLLQGDQYVVRPGRVWSCREYTIAEGTLRYTLGFGTTNKADMCELFDRMAKSFEIFAG
jgi:hypothetical protein